MPLSRTYRVMLTCPPEGEAAARALMLRTLALGGLHLSEIGCQAATDGRGIDLVATVSAEGIADTLVEQAILRLASEPGFTRVRWDTPDEG